MKPTHEQITQRAYEIYLQRGCPEGKDLEHWLEAERQLSAESPTQKTPMAVTADEGSARSRAIRGTNGTTPRKASARPSARA